MQNLDTLKMGFVKLQNELDKIAIHSEQWIQEFDNKPSIRLGLVALLTAESDYGDDLRNNAEVDQRLKQMIESGSDREAFASAITFLGREAPRLDPIIRKRFDTTKDEKLKAVLAGVASSQRGEDLKEWLRTDVLPHATADTRDMIQIWAHP